MEKLLQKSLNSSIQAKKDFLENGKDDLLLLVDWLIDTFNNGGKLLIMGNGGSAADAQHLAAEFVNRFLIDRPPLPALALTTDTSILTSVSNDFSCEDIFAKQIEALAKEEDLVMGISTSGNSPNVVQAVKAAQQKKIRTAALTGGSGGKLSILADISLNVPSDITPHIQETHLWIEHMLCWLVDERIYGSLSHG
ncbi:MAG: D-sedoheptulose-7-phosphate isomerase [Thermodesulfobacteriota bacterium]